MGLDELLELRDLLAYISRKTDNPFITKKAFRLKAAIDREIKIRTLNPITGTYERTIPESKNK